MIAAFERAATAGAIAFVILAVTWLASGHWLACLPPRWHAALVLAAIAGLLALAGIFSARLYSALAQDREARS